ncbi:hypothetical protein DXG01_001198, partial [Tephrocybe rancida]
LFMDANFNEEDHRYIMQVAREEDKSGETRQFRDQLITHSEGVANKKREQAARKAEKLRELMDTLENLPLVTHSAEILRLSNAELDSQLEIYRRVLKDPLVPLKKD